MEGKMPQAPLLGAKTQDKRKSQQSFAIGSGLEVTICMEMASQQSNSQAIGGNHILVCTSHSKVSRDRKL